MRKSIASAGCLSPASRAGFTLLEIMIVVGILGIVLAMGAPSFVRVLTKEPLRQAVSDVSEILAHARATAILRGLPAQARFRGDGQLTVELIPQNVNPAASATEQDEEPRPLMLRQLHPDVAVTLLEVNFNSQMEQPVARVRFHPNGTSDDFTIALEAGGGIRLVSLDPITALADVEVVR
jgi:prepilin-type N-terminal cleavage/methylation domain-containing protein